jgi:hypothetical protein
VASADIDKIIEEVRRLAPDEKRRVREALDRKDQVKVQPIDRSIDLSRELRWIEKHRSEYGGQWVAVRGDRLLSSGTDGREVYEAARAAGDERPFVTRVQPADELLSLDGETCDILSLLPHQAHNYDTTNIGITVPVELTHGTNVVQVDAKLDTGASFCIFERAYGEMLGLNAEAGDQMPVSTANSTFQTFGHWVTMTALGFQFDVMVNFAPDESIRRSVLGRRGFIDQLRLCLIEHDGEL